jgi:hypothetical protein
LSQALESSENDREAVTALAKSKGYDFSSEELWAEIQKRQAEVNQQQASGELLDQELEAVAGGTTPVWTLPPTITSVITSGEPPGGLPRGEPKW